MLDYTEWLKFTEKTVELLISSLIGILIINNLFVKLYIPGEIIYPSEPCNEPYMHPTSKDNFERINIKKVIPEEQRILKRSRYEFCDRKQEAKIFFNDPQVVELLNKISSNSSVFDIHDLYDVVRSTNRVRALKADHYGIIEQFIWSIGIIYMASNIYFRKVMGGFHDLVGGMCLDKSSFVFYLLLIIFLSAVFAATTKISFSGVKSVLVGMLMTIIGGFSGLILIFILLNLFIGGVYCTKTTIALMMTGFVPLILLAIIQAASFTAQIILNFLIDPVLRGDIRDLAICEMKNYRKGIIVILLLFTIVNSILYLSFNNMAVVTTLSMISALYTLVKTDNSANQNNGVTKCGLTKNILHKMRDTC